MICMRVVGRIISGLDNARDTVPGDTPASMATSASETARPAFPAKAREDDAAWWTGFRTASSQHRNASASAFAAAHDLLGISLVHGLIRHAHNLQNANACI